MASEAPEITALNENVRGIVSAVKNNLQSFANDLVRKGFIEREDAREIVDMTGNITKAQKVSNLMDQVHNKIDGAKDQEEKRAWFDSFVDIFSHSKAHDQLVRNLRANLPGPPARVTDDGGQGASTTPQSSSSGERDDIMCYTDWLTLPCNEGTHTARFAEGHIEDRGYLWHKKELKVYFMNLDHMPDSWKDSDGDRITRKEILKIANEWHKCDKHVVPKFVSCDTIEGSDIRVEFIAPPHNPSSLVGNDAQNYRRQSTMYLRLDPTKEEEEFGLKPQRYKRTIRHEFGHALGLEHEHQHPQAPPQYNHEKVKRHLMTKRNLTAAQAEKIIKDNWATIHSPRGAHSNYDRDSVMHYVTAVVKTLPLELSAGDRKFIVDIYSQANPRRQRGVFARNEEIAMETEDSGRNGQRSTGGNAPEGVITADSGSQPQATATEPQAVTDGAASNAITPKDFARFGKPNLNDLMEYVGVDLKAHWKAIALGLGLKSEIAGIQQNNQGAVDAPQDCMMDVFTKWEDTTTVSSKYSWKHLAEVLCSKIVNKSGHLTYLYEKLSKKK